jgi:cupin 2 domain-containing protein
VNNIFDNIPNDLREEFFETITKNKDLRIERIVSSGQVTPLGEWLCQEENEWVILLSGEAEVVFEDGSPSPRMRPGSYLLIESGRKHRVEYTDPNQKTVWLAIHYS